MFGTIKTNHLQEVVYGGAFMEEERRKEFYKQEIDRYISYIESVAGLEFVYNFIKKAVTIWK